MSYIVPAALSLGEIYTPVSDKRSVLEREIATARKGVMRRYYQRVGRMDNRGLQSFMRIEATPPRTYLDDAH